MHFVVHYSSYRQGGAMSGSDERFRPDVEAMRAFSIAGVLLFHARVPGFEGGFVGVDIFFVISGFLITGLLLREREATGSINLLAFWARRAWRLLPNALLVLTAILLATFLLKPPGEHKSIGIDVGASLLYLANYRFAMRAVDYFDNAQEASPVLHFWSLSVEEQFYLVWPCLLIFVCWRAANGTRGRTAVTALAVLIASLTASLVWLSRSQPAAFFHTEARIWQLAVGALLAAVGSRASMPERLCDFTGWIGLIGIVASLCLLSEDAYPGLHALPPVASAALLIASGGSRRVTSLQRFLASRPLQWLGRRSYSIYLWHWPILLFSAPQLTSNFLNTTYQIVLIFAVAAIAFRIVEDPLRRVRLRWPWGVLGIPLTASACVGMAAIGLSKVEHLGTVSEQAIAERIRQAAGDRPRIPPSAECSALVGDDRRTGCHFGDADAKSVVVLFGDSYAEHLFDGLDKATREAGWSLRLWTRASCPPVDAPSIDSAKRVVDQNCLDWREAAIRRLIEERPQLVIISAWAGIADFMADERGRALTREASRVVWRDGYLRVLQRLRAAGLKVAVVRGTPRGNFADLQSCLSIAVGDGCGRPRGEATAYSEIERDVAANVPGVNLVDLADRFCGPNVCYSVRDGKIVYRDRHHHLTRTFALTLAPSFLRLLQDPQ